MSYVCEYSSVQLDKNSVEKEFTKGKGKVKVNVDLYSALS